MNERTWTPCPICGQPDMRKEDGLILCTNLTCASNGGDQDAGRAEDLRVRLQTAWDDGYGEGAEAERTGRADRNPYRLWCPVEKCTDEIVGGGRLCVRHERELCLLLDAAGLPRPPQA